MLIFSSLQGDPLLLDSEAGLQAFRSRLDEFTCSTETEIRFATASLEDPSPYQVLLKGLRVTKAQMHAPRLTIGDDGWLELTASPKEVSSLSAKINGCRDGEHRHFMATPLSLIVEADDDRVSNQTGFLG